MTNWKDIKGYEGIYQVSACGRFRSLDRDVIYKTGKIQPVKGKEITLHKATGGYIQVRVYEHRKPKAILLHRLVYETFKEEISEGMQINHIDGNRHNNNLDNLEVVTRRENLRHHHIKTQGGLIGASYHKASKSWRSQIRHNKKKVCIGYYKTQAEAHQAYVDYVKTNGLSDKYIIKEERE